MKSLNFIIQLIQFYTKNFISIKFCVKDVIETSEHKVCCNVWLISFIVNPNLVKCNIQA